MRKPKRDSSVSPEAATPASAPATTAFTPSTAASRPPTPPSEHSHMSIKAELLSTLTTLAGKYEQHRQYIDKARASTTKSSPARSPTR
jgi:hypothetical protein